MLLSEAKINSKYLLKKYLLTDKKLLCRIADIGLNLEKTITVIKKSGQSLIVEIDGRAVALSQEITKNISVDVL